jgi:hypothetical protein
VERLNGFYKLNDVHVRGRKVMLHAMLASMVLLANVVTFPSAIHCRV